MVSPVTTPTYTNHPYLLADFISLLIQWNQKTTWRIAFNITDDHGVATTFVETYSPVDGKATVHNIHELLRPYFNISDHPGLTGLNTLGLKSLDSTRRVTLGMTIHTDPVTSELEGWDGSVDISGSENKLSDRSFVYSNAPSGFTHAGNGDNGIGSQFLSRCSLMSVPSEQPCAVSWFGHGETLKVKILHYVDGNPYLTTLPDIVSPDSDNMQTYNFTLQRLAELADIDVDDIIYVEAQMFLNSAQKDSIRFMHDPRHRAYDCLFAFIGAMGEPEFFSTKGSEQREADFEGIFLMEHHDYRKSATTLRCTHTTFTGPLSEEERAMLWDMAASPWVYVIEDGRLREVTITEVEFTDSLPHREPVGYKVKWRYASELTQRTFSRKPVTEDWIVVHNEDTIHGLE